jgi:phage/plasmid-like protein (TIGR03299 family)
MFSVRKTPWHRLGVVLNNPPTVAEGMGQAGLDWQVQLRPLFTADGRQAPAFATVRTDSDDILGVVGEKYRPLQNAEAFAWFQPFLDSGEASLETAGALAGGRKVWVLAKLSRAPVVVGPGDEVEKFLLLSNGHDGSLAVRVGFTPVRVVCANTLAMAHRGEASQLIRLKHSARVSSNLANVRQTVDAVNARFEATAEQWKLLARKDISQADLRKYVRQVLAPELPPTEDPSARMRNLFEQVFRLFEDGRGQNLPSAAGTAWGAYNAVSEYLGYEAGRSDDTRLSSLWFGEGVRINQRALQLALDLAA